MFSCALVLHLVWFGLVWCGLVWFGFGVAENKWVAEKTSLPALVVGVAENIYISCVCV